MTKLFSPKTIGSDYGTSPARIYADQFLYEKLGRIIARKEIDVLDIGCGSGYVREIFYNLGYKINYTGIDIEKHKKFNEFDEYAENSDFFISKIEDFNTDKKFDLVISMFALEHIEEDLSAVFKIKSFLKEGGAQLHMVPSLWSFFLYFKHGYRRYGPKKIKKMFGNPEIYRIGGFFSYLTHFMLITILKKIFKTTKIYESSIYPKILKIVNSLDKILPILPIAYIIVNFNKNENSKI